MCKCEDCKWYDTTRSVGGQDNIPLGDDGERLDFCGYHEVSIRKELVGVENSCDKFVNIFDDFRCKCCAECTKETEGFCPAIMCRNCGICHLKEFGNCRYVQCHNCGYCDYWDDHCYQDTWRESWDIYLIERFHDRFIKDGDQ